jgi:hypothetical protein
MSNLKGQIIPELRSIETERAETMRFLVVATCANGKTGALKGIFYSSLCSALRHIFPVNVAFTVHSCRFNGHVYCLVDLLCQIFNSFIMSLTVFNFRPLAGNALTPMRPFRAQEPITNQWISARALMEMAHLPENVFICKSVAVCYCVALRPEAFCPLVTLIAKVQAFSIVACRVHVFQTVQALNHSTMGVCGNCN